MFVTEIETALLLCSMSREISWDVLYIHDVRIG